MRRILTGVVLASVLGIATIGTDAASAKIEGRLGGPIPGPWVIFNEKTGFGVKLSPENIEPCGAACPWFGTVVNTGGPGKFEMDGNPNLGELCLAGGFVGDESHCEQEVKYVNPAETAGALAVWTVIWRKNPVIKGAASSGGESSFLIPSSPPVGYGECLGKTAAKKKGKPFKKGYFAEAHCTTPSVKKGKPAGKYEWFPNS